jgi:hypothetical protein
MVKWHLTSQDPGNFIIAADQRCNNTCYTNDHIWELSLTGGDPPAIAIQTTFGLRARNYRIFPRFLEGDTAITDPDNFSSAPIVQKFYPNYLQVSFEPFEGIDVILEYSVPDSNGLTGRMRITNSRLSSRKIEIQWAALLSPTTNGKRMAPYDIDSATVLCGQTANIFSAIAMTGVPDIGAGPFPALSVTLELAPGGTRELFWAQSAAETFDLACGQARIAANKSAYDNWDASVARLDILNQGLIQINTGDPDWDAAFALGHKIALGLCLSGTPKLPGPTFVLNRLPHHGYSARGDGSDYDHLWNGQPSLEAYYLGSMLLPASPEIVKGFLNNFIFTQDQRGIIDCKPGLAGQRSGVMATPILANLAWQIYEYTQDLTYLKSIFPALLHYIQAWFTDQQDRDGDGLPEWSRGSQSGFEDHPVFSQYQDWAQGGDISKVESPSLCAFLHSEIEHLLEIAKVTQETNQLSALEAWRDNLHSAVDASWNEKDAIFRNWDRESHFSPAGEHLGKRMGSGTIPLSREFSTPIRLSIRVNAPGDIPRNIHIFIHGTSPSGNYRIERVQGEQIRWHIHRGNICSEQIYNFIESVEVTGIEEDDQIDVEVMDLSLLDHTLLLPLWAGIPDKERARRLIHENIIRPDLFWKTFGIPACPNSSTDPSYPGHAIHMIWNSFIGEGLLKYGYKQESVELVTKLMKVVIRNLKVNNSFYNYYHAESGVGLGERNSLGGLVPIRLFLDTLGVRIISPNKVFLSGKNPFPWPVTLGYRGLVVIRDFHRTKITFPGGQTAIIKSTEPRIVTVEQA